MNSISRKTLGALGVGAIILYASSWAADRHPSRVQQIGPTATPQPSATSPSASPTSTQAFRQLFRAWLSPVNPGYSAPWGTSEFVVEGGALGASVRLSGLDPNIAHQIYLQSGSACPDLNADSNGDGIIDANEAQAVTSAPLVGLTLGVLTAGAAGNSSPTPFPSLSPTLSPTLTPSFSPTSSPTASLSPVSSPTTGTPTTLPNPSTTFTATSPSFVPTPAGTNIVQSTAIAGAYPMASNKGTVFYIGSSQLAALSGLPATSPTSSATPSTDSGTNPSLLGNLVIVVTGVDPSDALPSTVGSPSGESANQSLPVACGVLYRQW